MSDNGPIRRTELLTSMLSDAPAIARAQLTRIELAPGQPSGAHRHPCDVIGIVMEGDIHFQVESSETVLLRAGDPFFEPRDTPIARFDNASEQQSASFLACYLLGPDTRHVIDTEHSN